MAKTETYLHVPPKAAASISGYATEATLALLNGKVTACDTGNVTVGAALPTGTNTLGAVAVKEATGGAKVEASGRWGAASLGPYTDLGLTVNTRFHFIWDSDYAWASGADNNWYAGAMNDLGDLGVCIGSIGDTLVARGEGASSNGCQRVTVAGQVAHDAADSGNPIKIGGKARTANPTAVANGDRADLFVDAVGRPVVTVGQARGLKGRNEITLTNTTETTLLAAGGAGVYHDLVLIHAKNTSSSAVRVDIRDTTSGSVVFSLYPPPGGSDGFVTAIPVDQATANTNWTAQLSSAVTDVRVFIHAIKNVA